MFFLIQFLIEKKNHSNNLFNNTRAYAIQTHYYYVSITHICGSHDVWYMIEQSVMIKLLKFCVKLFINFKDLSIRISCTSHAGQACSENLSYYF